MANNIISEKLEEGAANEELMLKHTPCDDALEHDIAEARSYAAKLDRLVEAAKAAAKAIENSNACSFTGDNLTAALADIELPESER